MARISPQRAKLQPEHVVEKDATVEIAVGKAVAAGIELGMLPGGLKAERVEIGSQMAANAIGADQHQGADRVAGRLLHVGPGNFDAGLVGPFHHPRADPLFRLLPLALEDRDRAFADDRPMRLLPRGAAGAAQHVGGVVLEACEEGLPLGVERLGIGFVLRIEVFDIGGVAAIEKRGQGESGVRFLTGHKSILDCGTNGAEGRAAETVALSGAPCGLTYI